MATHDFNALVTAKASTMKAWRAANATTTAAKKAFDAARIAAGFANGQAPATPPATPPDWAALGNAYTSAIEAETPLKAAWIAAKKAQDDAEKDIGAL